MVSCCFTDPGKGTSRTFYMPPMSVPSSLVKAVAALVHLYLPHACHTKSRLYMSYVSVIFLSPYHYAWCDVSQSLTGRSQSLLTSLLQLSLWAAKTSSAYLASRLLVIHPAPSFSPSRCNGHYPPPPTAARAKTNYILSSAQTQFLYASEQLYPYVTNRTEFKAPHCSCDSHGVTP